MQNSCLHTVIFWNTACVFFLFQFPWHWGFIQNHCVQPKPRHLDSGSGSCGDMWCHLELPKRRVHASAQWRCVAEHCEKVSRTMEPPQLFGSNRRETHCCSGPWKFSLVPLRIQRHIFSGFANFDWRRLPISSGRRGQLWKWQWCGYLLKFSAWKSTSRWSFQFPCTSWTSRCSWTRKGKSCHSSKWNIPAETVPPASIPWATPPPGNESF